MVIGEFRNSGNIAPNTPATPSTGLFKRENEGREEKEDKFSRE